MRLNLSYNPNSQLYRVTLAEGSADYPPGRTLTRPEVKYLIERGCRVVISLKKPSKKPSDPWAALLPRRKR